MSNYITVEYSDMKTLLIGTGPIALVYAEVLKNLDIDFNAVGRNRQNCQEFEYVTGIKTSSGGVVDYLKRHPAPDVAIIAVTEMQLGVVASELIKAGSRRLLIEKPGGSDAQNINEIAILAEKFNCDVRIGYNRRFYSSVMEAEKLINSDEGAISFNFEFTEWSHKIAPLQKEPFMKELWFLHNSTHLIDLAFYLCGTPKDLHAISFGHLSWHQRARFMGCGVTNRNIPFSYFADWEGAGRWGLEIVTRKRRLILRPLEILQIQSLGSVEINTVEIDDKLDLEYKPGYYKQVKMFYENPARLLSIRQQSENLAHFDKILRG